MDRSGCQYLQILVSGTHTYTHIHTHPESRKRCAYRCDAIGIIQHHLQLWIIHVMISNLNLIKPRDLPVCRTYTGRAACWKHHRETISKVQGVRNSSGRITDFFHKLMAWKLNKRRKGTNRLRDSTDVSTKWYMLDPFFNPSLGIQNSKSTF